MAVFTVQLDDQTSAPAKSAAESVRALSEEFETLQKQLSAAEKMQQDAFKFHDKNAYKPPSESEILAQNKKVQQASLAAADADRDAAEGLRKQQEAAAAVSREFEQLTASGAATTDSLVGVKNILGSIVEVAVVGIVILSAYAKALFEAAKMAITLTQQKDALRSTFDVFSGGMGGVLLDDIEALAKTLPYTADQLNAWAKSMITAVGSGKALETAVRAVAAAQAIMGESGAAAAQGLIKRFAMAAETGQKITLDRRILNQMAEAGVSVKALAKELGVAPEKLSKMQLGAKELGEAMQKALIAQGAGPLAKLGNTWGSIGAKIREGFEDAFEDLGDIVDPFMTEVRSFASEFFAGGIAAEDFKGVVKSALGVAFEVARNFVNWLHRGFLHLQIASLQLRIALKPVTDVLGQLGLDSAAVTVALYLLKGTVIVLAVAFGILALAVALVALPFVVAGLAIYGVVRGIQYLIGLIGGAVANFDNLKAAASRAGQDMILGLANAIMAGHAWVVGLITNLATSMIGAIKTTLGIASPSRVMMRLGEQTAQGMAIGVQRGTPDVAAAAGGTGQAAATGAAGGARAGGGGGITVNVEAGAVVIHGASGDTTAMLEQALEALLERMLLQIGAGRAMT